MRNLKMSTVALLMVISLPALAVAQGGGGNKQDTRQANFGNVISALNNISAEINELNALNNLTVKDVQVVNISDFLKGNNVEAFNNALNRNKVEIANLQNVLTKNTILSNFLNSNKIAVSRVVAIDVLSGGGVTLFVQPAA